MVKCRFRRVPGNPVAMSTIGGMVAPVSVTKSDSATSTPRASKVPGWIDDLRASPDYQQRLQQRLRQLDQLQQLKNARDAMIDAATRRKYFQMQIEQQMIALQQQQTDLQQQMDELQQQMDELQQQMGDLRHQKNDLRPQTDHPGKKGELARIERAVFELHGQFIGLNTRRQSLRAEEESLRAEEESLRAKEESLRAKDEERTVAYGRLQAKAKASQAAVERFEAARAGAIDELWAAGALDDLGAQPYHEAQRIWLELQEEKFIVCSGGFLDRTWMILRSLFIPTVPVATVLAAATAEDAADAVLQLYMWERDRLLTLAKGAGGAAVTVLAGLIATGFAGKTGANSVTLFVAAPLVLILLFWAGFLLTGIRGLADQYPIARELVGR